MNELNHEVFDQIREWVETGEWKKEHGNQYNELLKAHIASYDSAWLMDLTDEEFDALQDDETDYFVFHLRIYIFDDGSHKIEFDPGLFDLMYKGYDTEEDRKAWQDFRNLAREKGVLYEP
jgi:hypothetical protein